VSLTANLIVRAFVELRLRADDVSSAFAIDRSTLDRYVLAPTTLPFPLRVALGAYLVQYATSPEQRQLGELLITRTASDASADAERFVRDELRHLPREEWEARFNAYLASPLVHHPATDPTTLAQIAANTGHSVDAILSSFSGS
jgi:hypothetical protein